MNDSNSSEEVPPSRPGTPVTLAQVRGTFDDGNYALARKQATELLSKGPPLEREAAQELLARMSPAPIVVYLLLLTFALLVAVSAFAYFN